MWTNILSEEVKQIHIQNLSVAISTWGTEPDFNAVVQAPKQTRLLSVIEKKGTDHLCNMADVSFK